MRLCEEQGLSVDLSAKLFGAIELIKNKKAGFETLVVQKS